MEPFFTMTIMQGPIGRVQMVSDGFDAIDHDGQPVYTLNNVTGSTQTTQLRQQMEQIINKLKANGSIPNNYIIADIRRHANLTTMDVTNNLENDQTVSTIIPSVFHPAIPPEVNFVVTLRPPSGGRKSRRKRNRYRKSRRY